MPISAIQAVFGMRRESGLFLIRSQIEPQIKKVLFALFHAVVTPTPVVLPQSYSSFLKRPPYLLASASVLGVCAS